MRDSLHANNLENSTRFGRKKNKRATPVRRRKISTIKDDSYLICKQNQIVMVIPNATILLEHAKMQNIFYLFLDKKQMRYWNSITNIHLRYTILLNEKRMSAFGTLCCLICSHYNYP